MYIYIYKYIYSCIEIYIYILNIYIYIYCKKYNCIFVYLTISYCISYNRLWAVVISLIKKNRELVTNMKLSAASLVES